MRGIDKVFYGQYANNKVDFDLFAGEVHSILGENGAGKTTLMNCLAGLYTPDGGSIYIEGEPVILSNPKVAFGHGIGMVHQHFMLVPVFTVWENIILGLKDLAVVIRKEGVIARIREIWSCGRSRGQNMAALNRRAAACGNPQNAIPRHKSAHLGRAHIRPHAAGDTGIFQDNQKHDGGGTRHSPNLP